MNSIHKISILFISLVVISITHVIAQSPISNESNIPYKTYKNDPTGLRLYTLDNGMKVYLSKNTDAPKIETLIAVKAGSTYDPAEQTGLAHYLEHMVFKGTSNLGTLNWEKEKVLLGQISDLYELHKAEKDTVIKKSIYRKIDSVSNIAANFAIANEYDKMISSIGAQGTNAFTSNEMTVYKNKIPSNELDKLLAVEKERFSELVLRLFHTELEVVYEEFNRGQDNDGRKQYQALLEGMFPNHPYGTQTTIGTAEHLKNPSMEAIHTYFDTYYVPNNMAIIMVGDIDYDETINKVNASFGEFKPKEVNHPKLPKESPITKPIEKIVYGPSEESIYIGFRTEGITNEQTIMVELIDYMLANSTAGLIDLNLNALQKVQSAASYTSFNKDYGMHILYGSPRKSQDLNEVKDLLLSQIELIKKGKFDDWLIDAIVNDRKLSRVKSYETTDVVAFDYMYSFVYGQSWEQRLKRFSKMSKITKKQVVDFANTFYKNNYVIVKKLEGEDPNQVKVENPKITPVTVNRDQASEFLVGFNKIKSPSLKVQKLDYKDAIKKQLIANQIEFLTIENKVNDLANMQIKFPVGNDYDSDLEMAFSYLDYLGNSKLTNEEIKKEFYKLGVTYGFRVTDDETIISISGLQESITKGLTFLLEYLQDLKVDTKAYESLVVSIEKSRANTIQDKSAILRKGLVSFSKYGEKSRLRNTKSIETLKALNPNDLITKVNNIFKIAPRVFYYGQQVSEIQKSFLEIYPSNQIESTPDISDKYTEREIQGEVYFVNYDMVQTELLLVSKKEVYDPKKIALSMLFNNYFGSGLSSIVFQEIRESKSLAYSAMSRYSLASKKSKPNYLFAYIGTQANKLSEAVSAMKLLLNEMPLNEAQFEAAKASSLKKIAAKRINKMGIFKEYERLNKLGIDKDNRAEVYSEIERITLTDLDQFFNTHIKNSQFDLLVLGNKKDVDFKVLEQFGKVNELTPQYLFNY